MKNHSSLMQQILDSAADGIFTVNEDFRITWFNSAAEHITGISKEEALYRPCCEIFQANICRQNCTLKESILTGKPIVNKHVTIHTRNGKVIPVCISTSTLMNEKGEIIGGVETFRDRSIIEALRKELRKEFQIGDLVSSNVKMREIAALLPQIAESDSTCLIQGESGTGKELVAKAIHQLSPRKDKPFISLNCGALPDTLLESELFGYEQGAFTDAKKKKVGRFSLAEGGTLFLDEIGDMSPALQVRLLRVLQEKRYEPLGGTDSIHADVRVLAATNKNLLSLVQEDLFRSDLYYRINVIEVTLPPLRERLEDIPLLAEHFITRFNHLKGKEITGISSCVLNRFMHHEWIGNIRELENAIEHAFILCKEGQIELHHLPRIFSEHETHEDMHSATLAEIEAHHIFNALNRNQWNRQKTASELDIDPSTLWRKIKLYELKEPESDS
ncbi:MAG: sigma 54-interacting transcriptional regulator [Candidatus Omnitrophica bacterium]|nr:sigma 54-interacting transcriptional regulator [Candidatus Omnitrophota bacterium]